MIYYGLLLFFIFEYLRPTNFVPALSVLRLNTVIPLGIVAGTLMMHAPVSNQDVWREPNTRMIIFMLGLIALSVLTADVTLYALEIFKVVFGYALIFWVISKQVADQQRLEGLLKTLVFVHIALIVMTPELITNPEVRSYLASGTFLGDGNDFALSVNLVVPFCIFLLLEARAFWKKIVYGGTLVLLVLSIVGTSSRGGTIALVVTGVYYWFKSDRKIWLGLGAMALVVVVFSYAPPIYFQRMESVSNYQDDGSAQGRLLAWGAGIRMAMDHPFLGVGAGHFPVKFGVEYRPKGFERTEIPWLTAHSNYFLILGELGVPGLAVLIALIVRNLTANARLLREIKGQDHREHLSSSRLLTSLSASVIAFAVGGAFLSAIYYPHIYVLAGLLIAGRRVVRERQRSAQGEAYNSVEPGVIPQPVSS